MAFSVIIVSSEGKLVETRVETSLAARGSSILLQSFVLSILAIVSSNNSNLSKLQVCRCCCFNCDSVSHNVVWALSTCYHYFFTSSHLYACLICKVQSVSITNAQTNPERFDRYRVRVGEKACGFTNKAGVKVAAGKEVVVACGEGPDYIMGDTVTIETTTATHL
jgi:hypothetical protein